MESLGRSPGYDCRSSCVREHHELTPVRFVPFDSQLFKMADIMRYFFQSLFPLLGLTAGLACSYLFSPTFMGLRVFTFTEWFSRYSDMPRGGTTIAVCAFVGITLGLFTSVFVIRGKRPLAKVVE